MRARAGGRRLTRAQRVLLAAVVAALAWAGSAIALAASPIGWSAPAAILGASLPAADQLERVACPSASLCVALDRDGDVLTSADPPAGAASWHLARLGGAPPRGLVCPSASLCLAWGPGGIESSSDPAGGTRAWTLSAVGRGASVDAISCPSTSRCLAVAGANTLFSSSDPAATSGVHWKLRSAHIDAAFSHAFGQSRITSLSCPSLSLCVAVDTAGRVLSSTHPATAVRWQVANVDPRVTTIPGIPGLGPGYPSIPATVVDASLTSVDCPSTTLCAALDSFGTIAYSQDPAGGGSAWRLSNRHPELLRQSSGQVSCASVSLCVFAGPLGLTGLTPGSVRVADGPLSEPGSFSTRRISPEPINGVSCAPTAICVAIEARSAIVGVLGA